MGRKAWAVVIGGGIALALALLWRIGTHLSQPVNHVVPVDDRHFTAVQAERTRGSLLRVPQATRCALLMHGVRADRSVMAPRALMLRDLGLTSLAIDLQGHGETGGEMITFGHREAQDARNGVEYLRGQGCRKVLVIGQSLGGAAALLGDGPVAADAFVLESVYPTIEDAVANRLAMRFGVAGRLAAPLLYFQLPLRAGVGSAGLRPLDAVRKLRVPVLVAGGSRDLQTPPDETRRLFDAVPGRKTLWLVEGAAHQDLHAFDPAQYRARLTAFIEASLSE